MFPDLDIDLEKLKTYKQSLWVAECYLKIQEYSGLTFEAIFMYISINEMYRYFDIYHEMDFSQILDRFNELFKKQSVMSILIDKYGYSLNYIAEQTGISYETLFSLKSRRRDIKKVNAYTIIRLSAFLNVRVETLSEIQFL